jgi:flagellar motor switch protein FliN/FliY
MEASILSFFEHWVEEFGRAVEMFTGERPTLAHLPAEASQIAAWEAKRDEFHWWQEETEGAQKFKAWVGAEEGCWTALSSADGNDPKELFQEMVAQASQGAAAVVSSSFAVPVKFGNGLVNAPPALSTLCVVRVEIKFRDAALPAIVIALEPAAAKILDGPGPLQAAAIEAELPNLPEMPSSMFERLMDLQLPISVLLGQTSLPIRDVLKITSGSLIELDRQLGDYVEIVIHGTVVARGEIVAIKGNYGVRIKEVISRKDRFALKDAA